MFALGDIVDVSWLRKSDKKILEDRSFDICFAKMRASYLKFWCGNSTGKLSRAYRYCAEGSKRFNPCRQFLEHT